VALGRSGRIGVDLVDPGSSLPSPDLLDLATSFERAWIGELREDPRRRLLELWACREALLKALGLGLALDPGAVELDRDLRPVRVLGSPSPPQGWRVETGEGTGIAGGMIVALAWTD
jgi:phosphopantetheinyl transferase